MKISSKLIIPIVTVVTTIGLAAGFIVNNLIANNVQKQMQNASETMEQALQIAADDKIKELNNTIKRIGKKALNQAALFTGNPEVIAAYELAHAGNINDEADPLVQQARVQLRYYFQPLLADYKQHTGARTFKMHFHLPNGRSMVRLWRDGWQTTRNGQKIDISDDISSFRKTVVEINQGEHQPLTGIEVGRGGFAIRGVAAINDEMGNHVGSNEVLYGIENLLKVSKTSQETDYAIYMDAQLLAIATKMQDGKKYPLINNEFVQVAGTNTELSYPLIKHDLLTKSYQRPFSESTGNYYLTGFPLNDYAGNAVGVFVILTDISKQQAMIKKMEEDGQQTIKALRRNIIIGMIFTVILVIACTAFLITKIVTKPLAKAVAFSSELSKGNLTGTLSMGTPQNCSSVKECGRTDCPSYGKETHCWVESGSFAVVPHCPHAVAGGDCRECAVYKKGIGDELTVMASALNSLKDEMMARARIVADIGNGILTHEYQVNSEKDTLGVAIKNMISDLSSMVRNILANSGQLTNSSDELSQVSHHLAASSQQISSQSATIAGATEEINANSMSVAETVQKISQSMQGAATDTEKMSSSISEIGQNAQEGSRITQAALDKTATATEVITALNLAAGEISEVTKVIGDISEQTKLLALNATIEASRAGEAGKGFAVVAGEVKELAHQTFEATNNISTRISEVQASTQQAVETISEVTDIVGKVNDSSLHITASVEEQVTVAQEIATAVAQANDGTHSISAALDELTKGTAEVSTNIQAVNQGTQENTEGITTISRSAETLSGLAKDLQKMMSKFKLKE